MSFSVDAWTEICRFIPSGRDLANLFLTGDPRIRFVLVGASTFRLTLPTPRHGLQAPSILNFTSNFPRLTAVEITSATYPSMARGKSVILKEEVLQRLPRQLRILTLQSVAIEVDVRFISQLQNLKRLQACLYIYNLIDFATITWPDLEEYSVAGAYWNMEITPGLISRLPASLTKLDLASVKMNWGSRDVEQLAIERDLGLDWGDPFAQCRNLTWLRCAPPESMPVYFPPNLRELTLEFASRPAFFWDKIPRTVTSLTTMTTRKPLTHHTCFEKDFEKLPRGLTTLHTHEMTKMDDAATLAAGMPSGLTSLVIKRITLAALEVLPATLTEIESGFEKHTDVVLKKQLKQLFPELRSARLFTNNFFQVPDAIIEALPFEQLTNINFGMQMTIPTSVWTRLSPNLLHLRSAAAWTNFTEQHFMALPQTLRTLEVAISGFEVQDHHIKALSPELRVLKLFGSSHLTDACVPDLPRKLEQISFLDNYSFTDASIPHWPSTLTGLSCGSGGLTKIALEERFSGKLRVQLVYRTQ